MAERFDPSSWVNGVTIPYVQDFQNIAFDIGTWGQNTDAAAYGLSNSGFVVLNPGALPGTTYTVTGASWTGSVASYVIGANNLTLNQLVTISGVTPSGYNLVQVPVTGTGTTITVAMPSNPGAWSSGGTVQAGGVSPSNGMVALDQSGALWTYFGGSWNAGVGTITVLGAITSIDGITTVGPGAIGLVASANSTGQTANISTTNLLASIPFTGYYVVHIHVAVTTPATTSSTLPTCSITYTEGDSSAVISGIVTASSTGNTTAEIERGTLEAYCKVGTALSFSTASYASVGSTHMAYSVHIRVEYLG